MNSWFRLHTDILADEKILSLSFADRWFFVAICALKCDGTLDKYEAGEKLDRKVAIKLGVTATEADELRRRLCEEELIDTNWQPKQWDRRQFKSDVTDPTAAERMRRYRNKRNATVTLRPPDNRIQNTETDNKRAGARDELISVLDEERTKAVIAHRKAIRKPLTQHAAKLLAQKFAKCTDPNAAADEMIARGWQGFDPEWMGAPKAYNPADGVTWVARDSPLWGPLCARHFNETGLAPVELSGMRGTNGSPGYHFRRSWIDDESKRLAAAS